MSDPLRQNLQNRRFTATIAAALAVSVGALYFMNSPSVKSNQASSPEGAQYAAQGKKADEATKTSKQSGLRG